MLPIPRLNRAQDMNRGNVGAGEGPIVHYLLDAGASRGDLSRQIGQATWPIANNGGEPAEATVGNKAALDDATQDVRINVPTAEEKDNAFVGQLRELTGETGGERSGGRALDNAFLQLDDP